MACRRLGSRKREKKQDKFKASNRSPTLTVSANSVVSSSRDGHERTMQPAARPWLSGKGQIYPPWNQLTHSFQVPSLTRTCTLATLLESVGGVAAQPCTHQASSKTKQQKTRAQLIWENSSTNFSLIFATRMKQLTSGSQIDLRLHVGKLFESFGV